jgi:hypothetical protein
MKKKGDLLKTWSKWHRPDNRPLCLADDAGLIEPNRLVYWPDWQTAHTSQDFCGPKDNRLHLGLIPQPFFGDLRNASVYILMINPSLGPHDYFGESKVPEYRKALEANLRQDFKGFGTNFMFLDPRFAWHGGFQFWDKKLFKIIEAVADAMNEKRKQKNNISIAEARKWVGDRVASLELIPYHSAIAPTARWVKELRSVKLAQEFAKNTICPSVESGDVVAVVLRGVKRWDLQNPKGIVKYEGGLARSASLQPHSEGGKAILNKLLSLL